MLRNQKPTGRAASMPIGLLTGVVVSLAITILGTAVTAKMMESESVGENTVGYAVLIMLLLASFGGATVSRKKVKRQNFAVCMLSGVLYFALLLSITALFFGGQYEAVGVTGLLVMCGSSLAMLAGLHPERGGKGRKRVKVNC